MKNFLLIILFAFSAGVSAQVLTFNPVELTVEAMANELTIPAKFDVANETVNDLEFLWRLERADVPEEWAFTICDALLCYGEGTEACPPTDANSIMANGEITGLYKVSLNANDVPYDGHVFFVLRSGNEEYARLRINFNIGMVSSAYELTVEDLAVFPNPTSDFFQLKNDKNVSSVAIYNIVGKEINSFNHSTSRMYDVSNLETGIYLVRFFDKKLNTIKTIKLSKL